MRKDPLAYPPTYLVESYWPGVTEPAVVETMRRARLATEELTGPRNEIRYVSSYLVVKDEVTFCLFEAASESLIEEACRLAELRIDRIVALIEIDTV